MKLVPFRSSQSVDSMAVDALRGVVNVCYQNGYAYTYINVSRRAIVNLLMNPNMSLGFWINNNCVNKERAQVTATYRYEH